MDINIGLGTVRYKPGTNTDDALVSKGAGSDNPMDTIMVLAKAKCDRDAVNYTNPELVGRFSTDPTFWSVVRSKIVLLLWFTVVGVVTTTMVVVGYDSINEWLITATILSVVIAAAQYE